MRSSCGRRVGTLCFVLCLFLAHAAVGEETFHGAIIAELEVVATVSGSAPFKIRIDSAAPIPPRAMVVVRGLPPSVKFSDGRLYGDGVWVMPPKALSSLQIQTASEPRNTQLNVALVALDGKVLVDKNILLRIVPASASDSENNAALDVSANLISKPEREAAMKMLEAGDASFKSGNLAIAREYYKRAANKGLAEAALALGATFDQQELQRFDFIVGVQPNAALAKEWYAKARALGSRDAVARLKRFE